MDCQKCGATIKEGKSFCSKCGTPVIVQDEAVLPSAIICEKCGKEIVEGKKFCSGCGTPVPVSEAKPEVQKKRSDKVPPIVPILIILLILELVLIGWKMDLFNFGGGNNSGSGAGNSAVSGEQDKPASVGKQETNNVNLPNENFNFNRWYDVLFHTFFTFATNTLDSGYRYGNDPPMLSKDDLHYFNDINFSDYINLDTVIGDVVCAWEKEGQITFDNRISDTYCSAVITNLDVLMDSKKNPTLEDLKLLLGNELIIQERGGKIDRVFFTKNDMIGEFREDVPGSGVYVDCVYARDNFAFYKIASPAEIREAIEKTKN